MEDINFMLSTIFATAGGNLLSNYIITQSKENVKNLFDKVKDLLQKRDVSTIIENPPLDIVAPAISAGAYTSSETLRDLYAKLIDKSMTIGYENLVHPSFVETIKQLSSMEALFFKTTKVVHSSGPSCRVCYVNTNSFVASRLTDPSLANDNILVSSEGGVTIMPHYIITDFDAPPMEISYMIDNLERLSLIRTDYLRHLASLSEYRNFYFDKHMKALQKALRDPARKIVHVPGYIEPTEYGRRFYNVCVK